MNDTIGKVEPANVKWHVHYTNKLGERSFVRGDFDTKEEAEKYIRDWYNIDTSRPSTFDVSSYIE